MLHEQLKTGKLKTSTKIGYGMGQLSETIPLSVVYSFFVFFLTNVAMVHPAVAGTISLIAIAWDAITDVLVGFLSDNLNTRWGRRRPFMALSSIPFAITMVLMFTDVNLDGSAKGIYFGVIAMLFWTLLTLYVLPYMSLGAEITQNPDERNALVKYRGVIAQIAMLIAMPLPTAIEGIILKNGGTSGTAWMVTGIVFGVILLIGLVSAWLATKGHELIVKTDKSEKRKPENMIKAFASTFRYKPWIVIIVLTFIMAWTTNLLQGGPIYLMSSNLQLSPGMQSIYFAVMPASMIIMVPILMQLAQKFGNKQTLATALIGLGAIVCGFRVIPMTSFPVLLLYGVIANTLFFAFLNIYFVMLYECCELDEFVTGKRREGTMTSCNYFFSKLGAATATWFLGLYLSFVQYDGAAAQQVDSALAGILNFCTLIPGFLAIVAGLCVVLYPVSKEVYSALLTALEAKRLGEAYSVKGFAKILPKSYIENHYQNGGK